MDWEENTGPKNSSNSFHVVDGTQDLFLSINSMMMRISETNSRLNIEDHLEKKSGEAAIAISNKIRAACCFAAPFSRTHMRHMQKYSTSKSRESHVHENNTFFSVVFCGTSLKWTTPHRMSMHFKAFSSIGYADRHQTGNFPSARQFHAHRFAVPKRRFVYEL